jgi:hypothetical protein
MRIWSSLWKKVIERMLSWAEMVRTHLVVQCPELRKRKLPYLELMLAHAQGLGRHADSMDYRGSNQACYEACGLLGTIFSRPEARRFVWTPRPTSSTPSEMEAPRSPTCQRVNIIIDVHGWMLSNGQTMESLRDELNALPILILPEPAEA